MVSVPWQLESSERAAARPFSQGAGVVIAIADNGVEISHPEFVVPAAGQPHYNFDAGNTNGAQLASTDIHGTAVAGYAVARGNNGIGVSGSAPEATLVGLKLIAAPTTAS